MQIHLPASCSHRYRCRAKWPQIKARGSRGQHNCSTLSQTLNLATANTYATHVSQSIAQIVSAYLSSCCRCRGVVVFLWRHKSPLAANCVLSSATPLEQDSVRKWSLFRSRSRSRACCISCLFLSHACPTRAKSTRNPQIFSTLWPLNRCL